MELVGGGCFIPLFSHAGVDELIGQTIVSFLTVKGALNTSSTCRAAAQFSVGDCAMLRGMTFKYLDLVYPQIPRFTSLRVLCLSNNPLGDQGAHLLANALITLAGKQPSLPSSLPHSSSSSSSSSRFEKVHTSKYKYDPTDILIPSSSSFSSSSSSAPFSSSSSRLEHLHLSNTRIGPSGILSLLRAFALGTCDSLLSLDLSQNKLYSQSVVALAGVLTGEEGEEGREINNYLQLQQQQIGEGGREGGFGRHDWPLPRLQCLQLANVWASSTGAAALAAAFSRGACPSLLALDLSYNDLYSSGARALLSSFASGACSMMRSLNLAGNKLGLEGAWEIARAFAGGWGQELRHLTLASNGLGSGGVEALMEAHLDLFLNHAGDEGACELAASLAHGLLPSLIFLDLAANRISQEGVGGLVSVLEEGGGRGGREGGGFEGGEREHECEFGVQLVAVGERELCACHAAGGYLVRGGR
ncbi:ankyrin repeat domain protein [Nannochloropsis oceanica]